MLGDHEALLAAICAQPDEDTPRLVYADFLEENGAVEQAAFVRTQVELARTPPWEPFAVRCYWRQPNWISGMPFRHTLPRVDGSGVEWPPDAFPRGLGYRLNVRSLVAWEQTEAKVLGRAPVGEMRLWAGTLDDWRRFATSPVIPALRKVQFANSPIEPLRELREQPAALGITDIAFERASGAGMPFVLEDLLRSPLGRTVRGLHFRVGYESLDELIDAICTGQPNLQRLSFATMGLTADHVLRLFGRPTARGLNELDVRDNPLGELGVEYLLWRLPEGIHTLNLAGTGVGRGIDALQSVHTISELRRLDLSHNPLTPRAGRVLSRVTALAGLRSLSLRRCRVGDRILAHLRRAKFWPNLVELDLRDNPIATVHHLLEAEVPADLAALVLDANAFGTETRNRLRAKYGDAVVFAPSESVGL